MKTKYGLPMFPLIFVVASAFAGGGAGSHTGDMLISEFTGSARLVAKEIAARGNPSSCVSADALQKAIDNEYVFSSVTVFEDGKEVDAKNTKKEDKFDDGSVAKVNTIEISRSRLINATDPLNYLTVVLHEHYGLLGLEGSNDFHMSQGCAQQLQILGSNLESLRYRVNPLAGTIERFSKGELKLKCDLGYRYLDTSDQTYKYAIESPGNFLFSFSAPQKPGEIKHQDRRYFGRITSLTENGSPLWIRDIAKGLATYEQRLQQWQVTYDVETGLTKITWLTYFDTEMALEAEVVHRLGIKNNRQLGVLFTYSSDGKISYKLSFADYYEKAVVGGNCSSYLTTTYGTP